MPVEVLVSSTEKAIAGGVGAERFSAALVPLAIGLDWQGCKWRARQSSKSPDRRIDAETLDGCGSAGAIKSETVNKLTAGVNSQVQDLGRHRGERRIGNRRQRTDAGVHR